MARTIATATPSNTKTNGGVLSCHVMRLIRFAEPRPILTDVLATIRLYGPSG